MKKKKNISLLHDSCFITHKGGFTLVELLLVIAIIGILISFLSISFFSVRQRTVDAQRKSDLQLIQSALEQYRSDEDIYPVALYSDATCRNGLIGSSGNQYMKKIPCDPETGRQYFYRRADAFNYTLVSCLNNTSDSQGVSEQNRPSFVPQGSCGLYYVITNP